MLRTRPWLVLVVALLAVLASFVTTQPATAADGRPFTNPVKAQKGADPWLEYYNGNYYLINTTFTNELLMRRSPTLAGLATAPSVQVWSDTTAGRNANMWAPEFHYFDGHWYLYYVAGQSGVACCDTQRTYVLESAGTENWIVYHANSSSSGGCGNARTTRAQKFTWNADGTPDLGTPVATGTTLAGPSGETATTPTAYTLVNRNSGKCLDVAGGGTADGTNVLQWTCNGGGNQKWLVEDQGNDTSRLVNVATGKVLDTADCSTADGADLRQWSWLNNNCQKFRLIYTSGDYVRIANANSGKVADVADCGTADGADVRQWSWLGNNCQQWRLTSTT
ncbi:RICIN domain-containing protein [Streptomyces sp. NPDC101234]|uniref:RICIN domain-containing protein n=1 Tax=Streptomyces sp. NPDC101234 TaxID=3366138 RepID=UPI00382C2B08